MKFGKEGTGRRATKPDETIACKHRVRHNPLSAKPLRGKPRIMEIRAIKPAKSDLQS